MNKKNILNLIKCMLFILTSTLIWWGSNYFIIASEDGFDPVRYEYYAREGLTSELLLSGSYRIVFILQLIYKFLPFYWGYILFVYLLMCLAFNLSQNDLLKIALFSPVSFYFIAQTGKDWLTILSLTCFFVSINFKRTIPFAMLALFSIMLCLFIRLSITPILIIIFIMCKYGLRVAFFAAIFLGWTGLGYLNQLEILDIHESTVQQSQSGGLVQLIREITFGYDLKNIIIKFFLYSISLIFQPALAFLKFINGGESSTYILFEGLCLSAFLFIIIRKKLFTSFLQATLPFSALLSMTQSFYHFRYLEIIYPVILIYLIWIKEKYLPDYNSNAQNSVEFKLGIHAKKQVI